MPDRPIIVIGASAGGVEAVVEIVKRLPARLAAAIFITVHFPSSSVSYLPKVLSRLNLLPARHPVDQQPIRLGQIYIAPPDYHLLIQPGKIHLSHGPKENGHRPAIDTMFRSAAYAYGDRVTGVILTGMLDDGTAGLLTIKARGGLAVVQDPKEALFVGMPRSAIEAVPVDWVMTLAEIAQLLIQQVIQQAEPGDSLQRLQNAQEALPQNTDRSQPQAHNPPSQESAMDNPSNRSLSESQQVEHSKASLERGEQPGNASPITCPDCGGVLWELRQDSMVRFRCHVGHAYSLDSLLEEQLQTVEKSLWSAVRALEEKAALARRMAVQAHAYHRPKSAEQFEQRAIEAHQHATVIRQLIVEQLRRQAEIGGEEHQTQSQTNPPNQPDRTSQGESV